MGKQFSISIDSKNFIAGSASSAYGIDGGFSPSLKNNNIDYQKGVIAPTDTFSKIADLAAGYNGAWFKVSDIWSILVSIYSTLGRINIQRYQAGSLGTAINWDTKNYSYSLGGVGYVKGGFFIASTTDIGYIGSGGSGQDEDWWTGARAKTALNPSYPHHFCKHKKNLVFCNSNYLNIIQDSSTVLENILNINDFGDEVITTICEHDEKVYMGIEIAGGENKGLFYLAAWTWDGNGVGVASQNLEFKIVAPDKIYSIISYRGRLYCFTEKKLFWFNGIEFIEIRSLNNPVYPNQITKAFNNFYFIGGNELTTSDNNKIIQAFNGSAFWFPYSSTNNITAIGNCFGDDMVFCENEDLNKIDINDRVGNGQFATLPIDFIENVFIRKITIEFAENMANGNVNTFKIYNHKMELIDTLTVSFASQGAVSAIELPVNYSNLNSMVIEADTFNNLIRRITIKGETSDKPL